MFDALKQDRHNRVARELINITHTKPLDMQSHAYLCGYLDAACGGIKDESYRSGYPEYVEQYDLGYVDGIGDLESA